MMIETKSFLLYDRNLLTIKLFMISGIFLSKLVSVVFFFRLKFKRWAKLEFKNDEENYELLMVLLGLSFKEK